MSLRVDEYGQPIILLANQDRKRRLKGVEAQKENILAAISLSKTLKTSLGPKGMDKIICSPDNDIIVTNDGATILSKMEVGHPCAKLLVELSNSQDDEIGDGTTGVVILAGALLEQAYYLIEKGLHPISIADGFSFAEKVALNSIEEMKVEKPYSSDNHESLALAAMTALGSKVVSSCQRHLAEIAVQAVLSVADVERKDVNFDLIKVEGKHSKKLEDTCIVKGIVLDKNLSHPQMIKEVKNAKIALLTCAFEPPKPKTKHKLNIQTVEDYKKLQEAEQNYFKSMIEYIEKAGANFVICQWGFDDEANHLLMQHNIPAIRWVGGVEIELIAIATGAHIISRFEDLSPEKLGTAQTIREVATGVEHEEMVLIEGCKNTKAITVVVYGGNQMIIEETKRCFHDAICCVRNLIKSAYIVPGGGSAEMTACLSIEAALKDITGIQHYAVEAFAKALLSIPEALANNCGLDSTLVLSAIRKRLSSGEKYVGLDCIENGPANMIERNVWESLLSKKNQISLATQVVRMILKIDDVIYPDQLAE